MKRSAIATFFASACLAGALSIPAAQASRNAGDYIIPDTSLAHPGDLGLRAHTNYVLYKKGATDAITGRRQVETPATIRDAYSIPDDGGSGAIALVDAYNYPSDVLADFNAFAVENGLPIETSTDPTAMSNKVFTQVYASGTKPGSSIGWGFEESLDMDIAHGIAPNAKIYLVEAQSSFFSSLLEAVDVASKLPGVREVSMSWGGGEFPQETQFSHYFNTPGVVYFASTGDDGAGTIFPSVDPHVVAVGGTSIWRNTDGSFSTETGWIGSGGGPSSVFGVPTYQSDVKLIKDWRGVPDVSADADPNSGINEIFFGEAFQIGGTSLSSPLVAAEHNVSSSAAAGSFDEHTILYKRPHVPNFRDIVKGNNEPFGFGYACRPGYDYVTGIGSPVGQGAF